MTVLRVGSATDTGLIRSINQDHILADETLFAVADGMGGHAAGEVASEVAIQALHDHFAGNGSSTGDDLAAAVREANAAVFTRAQEDAKLRGMGTTMTAAALVRTDGEDRLAIANVGDSRAYVFTQSELTQLTEDHSVPEELVRQGQLDPADVDRHPQRHMLTRTIGVMPEVDVDLWEILPIEGDRLLLCSDGLVREVTDDQIASVLRRLADPNEAAAELVARARAGGGADNISVVVIDVWENEETAPPILPRTTAIAAPAERQPDGRAPGKSRTLTVRLVVFVVLFIAVFVGGAYAVYAFARGTYYVAVGPATTNSTASPLDVTGARPLIIYQGRPGGLLWFDPTIARRTLVTTAEICPVRLPDLLRGHVASSISAANAYVGNLVQEATSTCRAR